MGSHICGSTSAFNHSRGMLGVVCFCFVLFIWPRHMTCGILVPRPGVKPRPLAVRGQSPNHWTAGNSLEFFMCSGTSPLSDMFCEYFLPVCDLAYMVSFFLAALCLRCCSQAFSICGKWGLLFVVVRWLLLLQSTGSRRVGFSSCGTRLSSCGTRA